MAEIETSLNEQNEKCDYQQHGIKDLSQFEISRILSDNGQRKTICALGKFQGKEGNAVLYLEKLPFSEEVCRSLCSEQTILKREFSNDIYGSYSCYPNVDLNYIKTTLVYPATDKHIAKYESSPPHLIEESPELYFGVTLPHITKSQFDLQWVYNILEHKKEVDRIVFEDDDPVKGFILLPDLKWDGKQTENLYLIATVHCHGIKSLRDLNEEHLPLLKNIKEKGVKAITDRYGLQESQLRMYFHYQPSFYHLHVHFTYLNFEAPGIYAEKSHLLNSVINNIELNSKYYELATIPFVVRESQSLFSAYEEKENRHIEIPLLDMCLIPESLSGLAIKENNLIFRLQTNSKSLCGSFKVEFLNQEKNGDSLIKYQPPFQVNSSLNIFCSCCLNKLTETPLVFDRILPLPSSNFEGTDLFCHQEKPSYLSPVPKPNDCLYGSYFIMIDDNFLRKKDDILYCDRCFSWLGTHNLNSVQLWNSTVLFDNDKPVKKENTAMLDFISIIKELSEGKYGITKIIMQCKLSAVETQYLLLWILEKKLKLLTHFSDDISNVILEEHDVIKLLYQFETKRTDKIDTWKKDLYVHSVEVSKQMLVEGLKHLQEMAFNIPEDYRFVNSMCVSYVGLIK